MIDRIRRIALSTPELANAVDLGAYDVKAGGVRLEALPADAASAWGRSPSWAVVDELCQWHDSSNAREVWDAISTAVPKVRDSRLAVITTAASFALVAWRV